jgi:hypothetical protein
MIEQEDLLKYKEQIETFISLQKKEDEDIFKSIQSCGEYIRSCSVALNNQINKGDFEQIWYENNEIIRSTKNMKLYLYAANKRAESNESNGRLLPFKQQ